MDIEKKYIKDAFNETSDLIDVFKSIETNVVGYRNKYGIVIPLSDVDNTDTTITNSIWANGFKIVGCISEDLTLPANSNLQYSSPLAMCVGYTLTVPLGTNLTII